VAVHGTILSGSAPRSRYSAYASRAVHHLLDPELCTTKIGGALKILVG